MTYEAKAMIGDKVFNIEADAVGDMWTLLFKVDGAVDKTGKGDEFKIFSAVRQAIEYLIKKRSPQQIAFSGNNSEKRASLYKKLGQRVDGYEIKTRDSNKYTWFYLNKKS